MTASGIFELNLNRALRIHGWMPEAELGYLAYNAYHSEVIIEAGCYHGRSTIAMADNTKGTVYAVDNWNSVMPTEEGKSIATVNSVDYLHFLNNTFHNDNIIVCRQNFEDFICSKKADFIFIDADHRYESVKKHILKALELSKPGTIIAGHDYDVEPWTGVKKAVDELLPQRQIFWSMWHYVVS